MAMTGTVDAANARIDLFIDWTPVAGTQLTGSLFRRVGSLDAPDEYVRALYQGELLGEQWYASDHEAPLDQQVWYAAVSPESVTTLIAGPFTIDSSGYVWMKDPGRPWADLRLDLCNTPTRKIAPDCVINPPAITDTFSRTVVDGWGSTDTGQAWTVAGGGGAPDFDVTAGYGSHTLATTVSARRSQIVQPSADLDMTVDVAVSTLPVGANLIGSLLARSDLGVANFYNARLEFTSVLSGSQVLITLAKRVASVDTLMVTVNTQMSFTAGQFFRLRFQVQDNTLRARAWPADQAEPDQWQVTVTDSNLLAAGYLGTRSFSGAGVTNPNPEVRYDNLTVSAIAAPVDDLAWVGFRDKGRAADTGIFGVLNRERPADVYARRKDITTTASFLSRSLSAIDDVYTLYTAGGPLLFQLPAVYGWPDRVVQPDTLNEAYISEDQRKPWRLWTTPLVAVETPVGEPQGTDVANWCAVEEQYATFADLTATGFTWGQVAAGQAVPDDDGYGFGPYGSGPYGDGG